MKHHAFAAAMGLLTAAMLVPGGDAQAAPDPTGYWVKPDSERNAKIQITRCGRGNAQLCSSIVWLENPNDSRGRPLHDVRNENPSMRDRPILGLPLFSGMTRTGASTWTGKIYNPEDGNTYSATLTMVSNKQIMLKGCKAWLLCGERMWLRTSPPPKPEPEEELIEAKAEPDAAEPAQAAAGAMPADKRESAPTNDLVEAAAEPEAAPSAAPAIELAAPAAPPAEHDMRPGYGFLSVSTAETKADSFSGESVPSMFTMADPIEADEMEQEPAVQAKAPPPPQPAPKPKAAATHATAAATPTSKPAQPNPAPQAQADAQAPSPASQQAALAAETEGQAQEGEGAETYEEATPPLTRRQKRMLRRQQRQMLPWLR